MQKIKKLFRKTWVKVVAGLLALLFVFIIGVGTGAEGGDSYSSYDSGYGYAYDDYGYEEGAYKTSSATTESLSYDYYYDEMTAPQSAVDLGNIDFTDAMVIKTAYLEVQVDDTNDAVSEVEGIAKTYGGYVSSSYTYEDYAGQLVGNVVFRVPADQFDAALEKVRTFSDYVSYESVDSEDVTETYMDLDARLGTYYELEAQYLSVLDSAVTVDEILSVYSYLQNVRAEIESLESSMQYYENQSSYSTITVYMEEKISVFEGAEKWRPIEVVREAFSGWIGFLQGLVDLVIWLVVYFWIVPVVWVVVRWFRRRRSKK